MDPDFFGTQKAKHEILISEEYVAMDTDVCVSSNSCVM